MAIFNLEYINESLFDKKKNNTTDNNKYIAFDSKISNTIFNEAKKIIAKYNNDPNIKRKVIDLIRNSKDFSVEDVEEGATFRRFKCNMELFSNNTELYIVMTECSQEYRLIICDIIIDIAEEIAKTVNSKYSFKIEYISGETDPDGALFKLISI